MWLLWWIVGLLLSSENETPKVITGSAQGTSFQIKYLAEDSVVTKHEIDSIFTMIDASLSLYQPSSLISRFNREGKVKMDTHMQRVIHAAMEVCEKSGGTFDVTIRSLSLLWKQQQRPSRKAMREARKRTGASGLMIMGDSLMATQTGVQIDCNGIAQGYTVDVLVDYLQQRGITRLMVELGGEVRTIGRGPNGREWRIGIESPKGAVGAYYPVERVIALGNKAVTTSASYRQPKHILDPLSGRPVRNGMVSVTVIAKDAMTADAWDNAFFVMGWKDALAYLQRDTSISVYMVYQDKQGRYRDTASTGFKAYLR